MARGRQRNGRQQRGGDAVNARGAGKQRQRQRGRQAQSQRGSAESPPSAAFLAALEAQRAKQATESVDADAEGAADTVEQRRAALPGFYYDEAKGRYFRLTTQQLRLEKKRRRDPTPPHQTPTAATPSCSISRIHRRGWLGLLAARELEPCRRSRDLFARFSASRLMTRPLMDATVTIDAVRDRFTAMDVARDGTNAVVGNASGLIRSFKIDSERHFSSWGRIDSGRFAVSSIRLHPNSPAVAISAIGAGVDGSLAPLLPRAGSGDAASGRVALFSSASFREPPVRWALTDPWVVEWSPTTSDVLAVGLGSKEGTAIIYSQAMRTGADGVVKAPSGRIESDTLSQAFFPTTQSPVVVNGSRNGSWWLWDTRAPRRVIEDVLRKQQHQNGAIVCLRMLRDERKLILQRSNGELSLIDVRQTARAPVLSLASGRSDAYRSMLRFDVNETETLLVAAPVDDYEGSDTIRAFDLNRGVVLGGCKTVPSSCPSENGLSAYPIEQVQIRETSSSLSLWGLSRNAVYKSHEGVSQE